LRLAAGRADLGCRLRRSLTIDVEHCNLRALAGKAERDGTADPGGRAGDDRNVILQKSRHLSRPPSREAREHSSKARANEGVLRSKSVATRPGSSFRVGHIT
jgi:hypothetical protein